uniref:Uncharacterized protein n=1 Tax=Ficedula albicollis TaxID=59894 RepID=A0A803VK27_FICAL
MALASVLRSELPEFDKCLSGFPRSFPEGSEAVPESLRDPPGPPRVLAAPPRGVPALPDGPGFEMLHGTTTLAFKVRGKHFNSLFLREKSPPDFIWEPKNPIWGGKIPFGTHSGL